MRPYRVVPAAVVLACAALHGAPSAAAQAATDPEVAVVDQRSVRCAVGDTCSFDAAITLENPRQAVKAAAQLESVTVPKNVPSSIAADSGFGVVISVPAKARSVSVSFNWHQVTGSASAVGGTLLTGFNQVYVILNATSTGCSDCTVFPDDGSGPNGSGSNAILVASSTKPSGNIGTAELTRTVTVTATRGHLPASLAFRSYFITRADLDEPGKVAASFEGHLHTITMSSS